MRESPPFHRESDLLTPRGLQRLPDLALDLMASHRLGPAHSATA